MGYIQHKSEESVEDYLETILVLSKQLPVVRSIDIANELEYSKPSVSVAMKNLRGKGYITVSSEGYIVLTEEGKKLAKEYRAENVYDFSLGNPNVPAPAEVQEAMCEIVKEEDQMCIRDMGRRFLSMINIDIVCFMASNCTCCSSCFF